MNEIGTPLYNEMNKLNKNCNDIIFSNTFQGKNLNLENSSPKIKNP